MTHSIPARAADRLAVSRPAATDSIAVPCKACGAATHFFADVDFSRTCRHEGEQPFPPSGELIRYQRCNDCGLVFTNSFDPLSAEQFGAKVYNADYVQADPEFASVRPHYFASLLQTMLRPIRETVAVLDFGGGEGRLTALMRDAGFVWVDNHDPFFGQPADPAPRYDLVTSFEVMEHARDPMRTFREAMAFLRPDGALLFSTMLQPDHVAPDWWYLAPRNGHVCLHTRRSLQVFAHRLDMQLLSINDGLHLFYRTPRDPVARLVARGHARSMLRAASLSGVVRFAAISWQMLRLGQWRSALNPRHGLRAVAATIGMAPSR